MGEMGEIGKIGEVGGNRHCEETTRRHCERSEAIYSFSGLLHSVRNDATPSRPTSPVFPTSPTSPFSINN